MRELPDILAHGVLTKNVVMKKLYDNAKSEKHQHRYTVVVEWAQREGYVNDPPAEEPVKALVNSATKVMCECGEIKEL